MKNEYKSECKTGTCSRCSAHVVIHIRTKMCSFCVVEDLAEKNHKSAQAKLSRPFRGTEHLDG